MTFKQLLKRYPSLIVLNEPATTPGGRRRVVFYSGRTRTARGIVVGEGETRAAALADAAMRLGKA